MLFMLKGVSRCFLGISNVYVFVAVNRDPERIGKDERKWHVRKIEQFLCVGKEDIDE